MIQEITLNMSKQDVSRLRIALLIARDSYQESVEFVNKYPEFSTSSDISMVHDEDLKTVSLLNDLIDLLLDY